MGNSGSSGRGHHDDTVDFGYLTPQGVYTGPRDWNQATVTQLIIERKLAPFYRPLEDFEDSWDDDQILAARKELSDPEGGEPVRAESVSSSSSRGHAKRPSAVKEPARHPEAAIYRGAIECPICFLYYPPNINRSRCCDQAICTECFVQIKRVEPTTTHIVSEPAACPYCVQENFGIVYTPPPWRAGLGSEGATPPSWPDSPKVTSDGSGNPSMKRRRKSFGHNDPEVVTVDHIYPDWEAKLIAVRAAVARRANRRIIMRQVGDRLIPVGVTSGRVHALPTEDGAPESSEGNGERGSRRSRRRQQNPEFNQFLGSMGLGGQDLEELMVMEAMRLSLLEHEAQQRRQLEEEAKKQREEVAGATVGPNASPSRPSVEGPPNRPGNSSSKPTPSSQSLGQQAGEPGSAPRSRTSTSSQAVPSSSPIPTLLSPPADRVSIDQRSGRRSGSGRSTPTIPYGTIGAAVLSAVSTASAVASPSPEREAANPFDSEAASASDERPIPSAHTSPIVDAVPTISEPSSSNHTTEPPTLPPLEHQQSFASSLATPSYDVLLSSPESTVSNEPLLEAAATLTTPDVESNDSITPSTT